MFSHAITDTSFVALVDVDKKKNDSEALKIRRHKTSRKV